MDQPLGAAVGNALEVREAAETITRRGACRTSRSSSSRRRARLLALSDLGIDAVEGRARAEQATTDGSAREMYERWIRAQGGDPDLDVLPRAPVVREVVSPRAGVVARLAALPIGVAALELGAGRRAKDDASTMRSASCAVRSGARRWRRAGARRCARARRPAAERAAATVLGAYEIGDEEPLHPHEILIDVIA